MEILLSTITISFKVNWSKLRDNSTPIS